MPDSKMVLPAESDQIGRIQLKIGPLVERQNMMDVERRP
jgi:hypothetical protein